MVECKTCKKWTHITCVNENADLIPSLSLPDTSHCQPTVNHAATVMGDYDCTNALFRLKTATDRKKAAVTKRLLLETYKQIPPEQQSTPTNNHIDHAAEAILGKYCQPSWILLTANVSTPTETACIVPSPLVYMALKKNMLLRLPTALEILHYKDKYDNNSSEYIVDNVHIVTQEYNSLVNSDI